MEEIQICDTCLLPVTVSSLVAPRGDHSNWPHLQLHIGSAQGQILRRLTGVLSGHPGEKKESVWSLDPMMIMTCYCPCLVKQYPLGIGKDIFGKGFRRQTFINIQMLRNAHLNTGLRCFVCEDFWPARKQIVSINSNRTTAKTLFPTVTPELAFRRSKVTPDSKRLS